jgi:hypothetical protein
VDGSYLRFRVEIEVATLRTVGGSHRDDVEDVDVPVPVDVGVRVTQRRGRCPIVSCDGDDAEEIYSLSLK